MADFRHGVYTSELATQLKPMTQIGAGLPVIFGTAPVHLATGEIAVNKPVLCYSYREAVTQLGYSKNWASYTLCEAMYVFFQLYKASPVVFVNVLDPGKHKTAVAQKAVDVIDGKAIINDAVLRNTLVVAKASAGQGLVEGTDYTLLISDNDELIITVTADGQLNKATQIYVQYDKVDASKVTADDVIGGIDPNTGMSKGLELVDSIFPYFRLVPGQIIAPGWSDKDGVARIMTTKAKTIAGGFEAIAWVDIPANGEQSNYTKVPSYKEKKLPADTYLNACYPRVTNAGKIYYASTHAAAITCMTDEANNGRPNVSPSNESIQIDGTCLDDGTPIFLNVDQANYLNGQGIVTAINHIGGWRLWGNRTTAYPSNTDVKESFIPIRRYFNWVGNTLITSFWINIDNAMNKQLVKTIVGSANIWLDGLTAEGCQYGGRVEFLESENTTTELMDGHMKFHTYISPTSPAEVIEFVKEYDVNYVKNLFS